MQEGLIIDTVVYGLSIPLARLPVGAAAVGMMAVQGAIHVAVPSVSGQAVLTIPVFAPLADLIGMTRQVAVLATSAARVSVSSSRRPTAHSWPFWPRSACATTSGSARAGHSSLASLPSEAPGS